MSKDKGFAPIILLLVVVIIIIAGGTGIVYLKWRLIKQPTGQLSQRTNQQYTNLPSPTNLPNSGNPTQPILKSNFFSQILLL